MISPVKIWRRQKETKMILGKTGKIVTWTKILVPGSDFKKQAPYAVVLVQLIEGKAIGQLVDYEEADLRIGRQVKAVLRKIRFSSIEEAIPYGIKFKPI